MARSPAYLYEKLTWMEADAAANAGKVAVIPIGAIEQHGPHLPLDVDCLLPRGVALRAAEAIPDELVLLPTIVHGYTAHVMDFPGTINIDHERFIGMVIDVGRSLAYHGFKKIIFLNGHGSNMPNLDIACRRVNLETDAECLVAAWWSLLTVDPAFMPAWRQSAFPGGCGHACELETSAYLHLSGDDVRTELIADEAIAYNAVGSDFQWCDLFGSGPATVTSWTSTYTVSGTCGEAEKATAEKGKAFVDEAARQLARLVVEFRKRAKPPRRDRHAVAPTMPMPWRQGDMRVGSVMKAH
ncbi:MAG: creatininase family protein [Planctomycetes bacterium]|nr:creatininase family protein [Planctomycetota bacterium]